MTAWPLEELLPHRPPMLLIDAVEAFDAEARSLTARVTITPGQLFFDGDGVPGWVAIEYMAQASAALAGSADKSLAPDRPARPGLLLGTRRLDLKIDRFAAGRTYRITSTNAFSDADTASFACAITDEDGETVATAILSAYRPPDLEAFLREQATA